MESGFKIIFFIIALTTLCHCTSGEHSLVKRVLPTNKRCNPSAGTCRKGDWIRNDIADCHYANWFGTCDTERFSWSWIVEKEKYNRCRPSRGLRLTCGDRNTNTRCVCSAGKFSFNQCRCQYWPNEKDDRATSSSSAACTSYYTGGRSGVHHWVCCNNCNEGSRGNSCNRKTYQGGSSEDYCDKCGKNTGGGRVKYTFGCKSCSTQRSCERKCNRSYWRKIPGLCWLWADCFKDCCLRYSRRG